MLLFHLGALPAYAAVVFGSAVVVAQDTRLDHSNMPMQKAASPESTGGSAAQAFKGANDKMHMGMQVAASGNADVDFIKNMMPHHQGAIDMAKIELQYGKDPKDRKLAQQIIKMQTIEIAFMKAWLTKTN